MFDLSLYPHFSLLFLIANLITSSFGTSHVTGGRHDLIRTYQLTKYDKAEIVRLHNEYRRQSGSSDMKLMSWDDKVAGVAEEYVKQCKYEHSPDSMRQTDEFPYLGENIYKSWTSGSKLVADGVNVSSVLWHDREIDDYRYSDGYCKGVCGHYTQMVWADTYKIGCGAAFCKDSDPSIHHKIIVSCNYGPGGNVMGRKPFKKGFQCSQCSDDFNKGCQDGLCWDGKHYDYESSSQSSPWPLVIAVLLIIATLAGMAFYLWWYFTNKESLKDFCSISTNTSTAHTVGTASKTRPPARPKKRPKRPEIGYL